MTQLDKIERDAIRTVYTELENKDELSVKSPRFQKHTIDYLLQNGLIEKIADASTLSGWAYVIGPTHEGKRVYLEILESPSVKIENFIKQGETIMKEEFHSVTEPGLGICDYISGPKSDQWFSEISIFNSRVLKEHPLNNQIAKLCDRHAHMSSPHEEMLGYLRAIAADNTLENEKKASSFPTDYNGTSLGQMLTKDIERCENYLNHPSDDKKGQSLYIDLTSKYDSIIPRLGDGLYQYIESIHFYDPEISADTLVDNLRMLQGKMIAFQARELQKSSDHDRRKAMMLYDVFVSHANDDKLDYVDELKASLDKLGIRVFYDKDVMEWGDKWKDKILEGVAKSEFAIIVISEKFFGREWTEKELNELLNRQNTTGQKIILPILHNISMDQLRTKYPEVADIQALYSSKLSCDDIALKFAGQLIKRLKA